LSCANRETFQWLQGAIADTLENTSSSQVKLQLVTPAQVPKLLRMDYGGFYLGTSSRDPEICVATSGTDPSSPHGILDSGAYGLDPPLL